MSQWQLTIIKMLLQRYLTKFHQRNKMEASGLEIEILLMEIKKCMVPDKLREFYDGTLMEFGLDPQAAIAAPRVIYGDALHWTGGTRVGIDREIAVVIGDSLAVMGHDVVPIAEMPRPLVGMVNAVAIDPETGTFVGGAEIRMDGHVSGY